MGSSVRNPVRLFGLLAVLFLVLPGTALAQERLAKVENFGDALVFHPLVEFERLILTVTGPCDFQYRQVVTKGELSFKLGLTTIDGVYTYNLMREEPVDPGVVKVLLRARQTFDEEAPRALCRDGKLPGPPVSQSEGFFVSRQEIIYDPFTVEKGGRSGGAQSMAAPITSISAADFVINDDLIVDGSACIGFDCVNGESFGFDTLRLKENNLRIKFDDTSVAASYPRNDWQLTANDSANGGASKFSIDDISGNRTPFTVEANARSHSLYVDDGGRIGSRTSTPSVELHTIDGDTPTLRLQQDGSSGFAPQTWDVAGNETNFFVRDVTNGSALPLRIRPGAPTSSIFIDVNGDVGVGTSSPEDRFHVSVAGPARYKLTNTTITNSATDDQDWIFNSNGTLRISAGSDAPEFTLDASGNLTLTGTITVPGGTLPDYVFEAGYELMPLADLAAYVDSERHLPNVPSAEEVAAGGLNMTAMQIKLLEKVEELTLYTLSQEATITSQEATIADIKAVNSNLKARLAALEAAIGLSAETADQ